MSLRPHRTDTARVRAYRSDVGRDRGAACAALFLDRYAGVVRAICARSTPIDDLSLLRRSLDRIRGAGATVAVASHNREASWETFDVAEIGAMHERIEAALGPVELWCVCLVEPGGSCACSAPNGGVLATGADVVGLAVDDCTVATDDGRLMAAAEPAGTVLRSTGEVAALARAVESVVR